MGRNNEVNMSYEIRCGNDKCDLLHQFCSPGAVNDCLMCSGACSWHRITSAEDREQCLQKCPLYMYRQDRSHELTTPDTTVAAPIDDCAVYIGLFIASLVTAAVLLSIIIICILRNKARQRCLRRKTAAGSQDGDQIESPHDVSRRSTATQYRPLLVDSERVDSEREAVLPKTRSNDSLRISDASRPSNPPVTTPEQPSDADINPLIPFSSSHHNPPRFHRAHLPSSLELPRERQSWSSNTEMKVREIEASYNTPTSTSTRSNLNLTETSLNNISHTDEAVHTEPSVGNDYHNVQPEPSIGNNCHDDDLVKAQNVEMHSHPLAGGDKMVTTVNTGYDSGLGHSDSNLRRGRQTAS